MAVKKKVKIKRSPAGKSPADIKAMVDQDFMTEDQIAPSDKYQTPKDVEMAAKSAELAGIKFLSEDERQSFMKMSDEEKTAFIEANKSRSRKRTIRASSLKEQINTPGL